MSGTFRPSQGHKALALLCYFLQEAQKFLGMRLEVPEALLPDRGPLAYDTERA